MAGLILGQRVPVATPELRGAIERGTVAGLLWFREAFTTTVDEARERVAAVRALWPAGTIPLFAADEEGGLIQQLSGLRDGDGNLWWRLPSPRALGRGADEGAAFSHGREIGRRLRVVGLDVALAPLIDLDPGPESPVLGTRCFGEDPDLVVRLGLAWLRGLADAGILGCVKHYPGHGATAIDTHEQLPRIGEGLDVERHRDPFQRVADAWRAEDGPAPGLLTAHLLLPGSPLPATLDPDVLEGVPDRLGPIWTDSLDMGALSRWGDLRVRAESATRAGADLLVVGVDVEAGISCAEQLKRGPSEKVGAWVSGGGRTRPIPEPWAEAEIARVAAAGIRILADRSMPGGDWDWILPDRFDPYGPVPEPACVGGGRRRAMAVLRYANVSDLRAALAVRPARPALVGWIHRGAPEEEIVRVLRSAGDRVAAVAHLLDGSCSGEPLPRCWTIDTAGFGEGEMQAAEEIWRSAPD